MTGEPEIRYLGELQRLELKPGDVFVLSVPRELSNEEARIIRKQWDDNMPGVKLIVLSEGMTLGVVSADNVQPIE